jgi:hypothetical protein
MDFKYELPSDWVNKILDYKEFANGGLQVSVKIKNGHIFNKILISNYKWIVAARGYKDLPFKVNEISEIFQTDEDIDPAERGGWDYWDNWQK